jgi:hypothetical protein
MPDNLFNLETAELPAIAPSHIPHNGENMVRCHECNCEVNEGDAIQHNDAPHCPDCVGACENCGHTGVIDDAAYGLIPASTDRYSSFPQRSRIVCLDCRVRCADCDDWFVGNSRAGNENANGDWVCCNCGESYTRCEECNSVINSDDSRYCEETERSLCQSCYEDGESRILHSYSHKPSPHFHKTEAESLFHHQSMFAGIEIEVDSREPRSNKEGDIENAGIPDAFYCKEDGSLDNGFEIVSHPATWGWWKSQDFNWLLKLKLMKYRSYNTSTCGMHIHLSRSALSELDIFKLLQFTKQNANFIQWVSRRTLDNLTHWAAIESGRTVDIIRKIKHGAGRRYEAINLAPSRTIEFRIFRGTLERKGVVRNLAFTFALVWFAKDTGLRNLTYAHFKQWIVDRGVSVLGYAIARDLLEWMKQYPNGR